jgi:NTP pyrophosphatase (non-canonical NTP hydrolase)
MNKLQDDIFKWFMENFSAGQSEEDLILQQLAGMIEETGELTHGILKLKQQIRKDENHIEQIKDAIGDILIFECNLCSLVEVNMDDVILETGDVIVFDLPMLLPINLTMQIAGLCDFLLEYYLCNDIANCIDCEEATKCNSEFQNFIIESLGVVHQILQAVSNEFLNSESIIEILKHVAEKVLKRDWNKHRQLH